MFSYYIFHGETVVFILPILTMKPFIEFYNIKTPVSKEHR